MWVLYIIMILFIKKKERKGWIFEIYDYYKTQWYFTSWLVLLILKEYRNLIYNFLYFLRKQQKYYLFHVSILFIELLLFLFLFCFCCSKEAKFSHKLYYEMKNNFSTVLHVSKTTIAEAKRNKRVYLFIGK